MISIYAKNMPEAELTRHFDRGGVKIKKSPYLRTMERLGALFVSNAEFCGEMVIQMTVYSSSEEEVDTIFGMADDDEGKFQAPGLFAGAALEFGNCIVSFRLKKPNSKTENVYAFEVKKDGLFVFDPESFADSFNVGPDIKVGDPYEELREIDRINGKGQIVFADLTFCDTMKEEQYEEFLDRGEAALTATGQRYFAEFSQVLSHDLEYNAAAIAEAYIYKDGKVVHKITSTMTPQKMRRQLFSIFAACSRVESRLAVRLSDYNNRNKFYAFVSKGDGNFSFFTKEALEREFDLPTDDTVAGDMVRGLRSIGANPFETNKRFS